MDRTPPDLVIDARPRGPRGPLAAERVQGRTVLDHLLDLATTLDARPRLLTVHAPIDDHDTLMALASGRFVLVDGPPSQAATVLRTDRLYDRGRLHAALRRGDDPESAVVWRIDRPSLLSVADEELTRRRTYQPLGRFWALGPARRLARALLPTRVRPNAVTVSSALGMLIASGLVAFSPATRPIRLLAAGSMALALVLDTADGHLARLQGTTSAFGRWLDAWLDEFCDMTLHAAIAWSAFARTGSAGWLLAGMAYAMGKFMYQVGVSDAACITEAALQSDAGGITRAEPRGDAGGITEAVVQRLRAAVRMAGHADVRWHLWIVLAAAGHLEIALGLYAAYFPARAVLGAAGKAVRHGR